MLLVRNTFCILLEQAPVAIETSYWVLFLNALFVIVLPFESSVRPINEVITVILFNVLLNELELMVTPEVVQFSAVLFMRVFESDGLVI